MMRDNFPYPGEQEFTRDHTQTLLENLRTETIIRSMTVDHIGDDTYSLSYRSVFANRIVELKFYLKPYHDDTYIFGWVRDYAYQERTWHFVIKDLISSIRHF
jgi:hypothetical protein